MSDLKLAGKIIEISKIEEGTSKAGKPWSKLFYTILTDEKFPEEIQFEVFGQEKIEQFKQYNVLNDIVTVSFNIKGWKWNEKRGCNLSSWRCVKNTSETPQNEMAQAEAEGSDDLPF